MTPSPGKPLTVVLPPEGWHILAKLRTLWTETFDEAGQITIDQPDDSLIIFLALQQCQFMRERPISVSASLSPSPSAQIEEDDTHEPTSQ
jgi:hypothetical protein